MAGLPVQHTQTDRYCRKRRFVSRGEAIIVSALEIGPGPVRGQGDHVGVVRGQFFNDAGESRAAVVANASGE